MVKYIIIRRCCNTENIIKFDENYKKWIRDISTRYAESQIKAAISVNREMLEFYWSLGRDIDEMYSDAKWGTHFYDNVSKDLQSVIPDAKGLSPTNIKYMKYFYELYRKVIGPQLVDELKNSQENITFEELLSIPWGHHRSIIDKCKDNPDKAVFYIKKTIENNWSRSVLSTFLDTNLYERQGKAVTNFKYCLPKLKSDLAQELTKDPYNFDFLTIRDDYDEKELKDALMVNIQKFLLELGSGFSFLGKEYRLNVGGTDQFIDMLFYNIELHCYVVIEVKTSEFEPSHIGQLGTYVVAVNHILKKENDGETIGLLICKNKNNVVAQYSLESSSVPIGISKFEFSDLMPKEFKSSLPTIEEIEERLKDIGE